MVEEPRESEAPTKKYVVERWWHRLLKTIKYISTLVVVIVSGAFLFIIYETQHYTYSYSFEPDYAESKGKEFKCKADDFIDSIDCGDLNNGENFIAKYIESKPTAKIYYKAKKENLASARKQSTQKTQSKWEAIAQRMKSKEPNIFDQFDEESVLIKELNKRGFSNIEVARFIIENKQIKYKRQYNLKKLTSTLGVTLLIAITWYILALVLYKIILYIVHGHTRVRKPTPNP